MSVNVQHIRDHIHDAPFIKGFSSTEIFGNEDKGKAVTCDRFSINGQNLINFKAPADGFAIVLEGELDMVNVAKGDTVHLNAGDIVHLTSGAEVKWSSPTTAHGVCVSLKPLGDLSYRADVYS